RRSAGVVRVGVGLSSSVGFTLWMQNEDLAGEIGVNVVVAHERRHASPADLLDEAYSLLRHGFLIRAADAQHCLGPPVRDQALLTLCESIAHHTYDQVSAERGPRTRRAASRMATEQARHRVRDRRV